MAAAVGVLLLVLGALALKNPVLLRMSVRNIPRRPAQSGLIVFGLMLASLIIMASFGVGDTLGYSLKAIQVKQTGGIDEAVVRSPSHNIQGAGFTDADYFTASQASDVIARVKADPHVQVVAGVIVSDGSLTDTATSQSSAENVLLLGAPANFDQVWGRMVSRTGRALKFADLAPSEVFIGNSMADKLNAKPGDEVKLAVGGKPTILRVRDVLNTEVNPNVASQGPVVSSVLVPIATMRTLLARPAGFNLVYIRNQGSGGLDDLGPSGVTGREISRRLRGSFTDPVAAAGLKAYLQQPAILAQLQATANANTFLSPLKASLATLLHELHQPGVTDEFKSIALDENVRGAVFSAVTASMPGASAQAVNDAQAHAQDLYSALSVDTPSATKLKAILASGPVAAAINRTSATLATGDPGRKLLAEISTETARPDVSPHFEALVSSGPTPRIIAQLVAAAAPTLSAEVASTLSGLSLNQMVPYKQAAVDFAEQAGLAALALLLGVSFFSITVGVLLIFLIFVMLASERRAEMGMSRAVGLKRRHLTQMFLFEGFAYTIGAAAVGVTLGIGVGMLMIGVISSIFTGFYKGLDLTYHVEPANVVIAFCIGILLTFIVVGASAYRVSRLNIVAAIRDIDESGKRDIGLGNYALAIFGTLASGARMLFRGHPLTFLRRSTLGVLGAIRSLVWALFRRGPLTLLAGFLLVSLGLSSHVELLYDVGVGISCIGIGLVVRWLLATAHLRHSIAGRIGFTLAALGLVVYFGQPFGRVEKLLRVDKSGGVDKLTGGPELFIAASLLLLLGAIWLVMYNSDLLVRVVMIFGRSLGSTGAAVRTSMSYPMATKFRTGMTVAMFATVTFIIAYMAVFEDVLNQNLGQATTRAGGWHIVAGTPDNNFSGTGPSTVPTDLAAKVNADPSTAADVKATGWENAAAFQELAQVINGTPHPTQGRGGGGFDVNLHVVDDNYLAATTYALTPRAQGYSSDRAVWDAVRSHQGYAVIDANVLQATNGAASAPVTGIKATDATFKPFEVELNAPGRVKDLTAKPWRVTVIGFTKQPLWEGLYVSTTTVLSRASLFVPAPPPGSARASSSAVGLEQPLSPTGYYFALKPGVDAKKARLDLGRLLVNYQLEPVIVADQLAQQSSGNVTLFNLLSGFLALGLIVGIAGLGVISTRAVVERRQQIGMMRALGFRRSLVQASFLMESSFIAILGLAIGAGLGIWQSYRFIVVDKSFGEVDFHVPVVQLVVILGGAYLATLLTTYLPARAASRVSPAEALRYE